MYNELTGQISFALIFLGFNVTFFPQFILGVNGMPRRYADYKSPYEPLNQISTFGSWLIATGFIIAFNFSCLGFQKGKESSRKSLGWENFRMANKFSASS